jgi:uncharacterized protein YndB with AHSA1/START domain
MRWLVLILALLAALVIAIFIIGAMLPVSHVATGSVIINQPPEAVWRMINDHAKEPKWRRSLKATQRLPDRNGHEVWEESDVHDNKLAFETIEAVPPKRLVRQIVADENAPFSGRWEIDLTPVPRGTNVQITEKGEVNNAFFRFVSRFIMGHTATINEYLKNLAGAFGESSPISTLR